MEDVDDNLDADADAMIHVNVHQIMWPRLSIRLLDMSKPEPLPLLPSLH